MLQRRLAIAARTSAADLHLREQALYALWLENDAAKSLQLAMRNWEMQKGWEDADLVLRIAGELHRDDAIRRIREWQQAHAAAVNT